MYYSLTFSNRIEYCKCTGIKLAMNLEFDKSTSIEQNNFISQKVEKYILQQPEVATVFSNIGGLGTGIGSLGLGSANKTEFTIQLKSQKERNNQATEEFMKKLREELKNRFRGINYSMAALGLIPRTAPIEITLSGIDPGLMNSIDKTMKMYCTFQ